MTEETKASLEAEHQKVMAEISTRYKSIRITEEEKLQQQEAIRTVEEELEVELAAKRTELKQQHQQQLDELNLELKEKLTNLHHSHQEEESKQKEEFAGKLEQLKSQLEKVQLQLGSYNVICHVHLSRTMILSYKVYTIN